MAKYRCPGCKKIVERDSEKGWIKSYCEKSGKNVRLQRVGDREKGGREMNGEPSKVNLKSQS